ncbi:unnamed protein product [Vicia faba]|uniref:Uncharacterized protein n=1 Tax=Vicia faba TaxID=3906 RepID=A0AAV1AWC4_VICFA|nr:unnamed protein product [Vicia faba]
MDQSQNQRSLTTPPPPSRSVQFHPARVPILDLLTLLRTWKKQPQQTRRLIPRTTEQSAKTLSSAELPVDQMSQAVSTITSSSLSQSGMLPPLNTITNSSNFQSSNPASPLNSVHTIGSPA